MSLEPPLARGLVDWVHVREHVHRQGSAGRADLVGALRADPGRTESTHDLAFLIDPTLLEREDFLHGDRVLLHTGDLGDRRHSASAIR